MDPVEALIRLGGVASTSRLLGLTTRRALRTALERGDLVRVARGRFRLRDVDESLARAVRVGGALALRSAALAHGWAVKVTPTLPEVAVSRTRHRPDGRGVRLVWVPHLDPRLLVTPPLETVLACARLLAFDEALAIADSALRSRMVTHDELVAAADLTRGAGAARVRRVAAHADGRAANPFESVLRAITIEAGLLVVPQHPVDVGERVIHPDLVDPVGRVVLEADSWAWHTGKQAHVDDCWRYNALVCHDWSVLRFAWEHVMFDPEYVREVIDLRRSGHAEVARDGSGRAVG